VPPFLQKKSLALTVKFLKLEKSLKLTMNFNVKRRGPLFPLILDPHVSPSHYLNPCPVLRKDEDGLYFLYNSSQQSQSDLWYHILKLVSLFMVRFEWLKFRVICFVDCCAI
jgi:hypothetical protein